MKLYSPDKSLLIEVRTIRPCDEGLVLEGKIMGAMPMKATLRPEDLRGAFKLLSVRLVFRALSMLVRGR